MILRDSRIWLDFTIDDQDLRCPKASRYSNIEGPEGTYLPEPESSSNSSSETEPNPCKIADDEVRLLGASD